MSIVIKVPLGVGFGSNSLRCFGLKGTDSVELICDTNTLTREITVTSAFINQADSPGVVKIAFDNLKNPEAGVI